MFAEANGAESEQQPALPCVAGNLKALSFIYDELGVLLPQGLRKRPTQLACPLPAAHALQAWAERLAGPNVAEHLLELRDWRGLQRDALTVWTCPPPVAPARVRAKPSLDAQARRGISASARRHLGNKLMRAG